MDQKAVCKKRILNINTKNDKNNNNSRSGTESEDDHHIHIWTERERRKKMRNMFASLRDLLPSDTLPLKADKSSIVDEAVKHIKTLEHTLQTLQKQKLNHKLHQINSSITTNTVDHDQEKSTERSHQYHQEPASSKSFIFTPRETNGVSNFQTWFSPNVVVNMCGDDAHLSVCSPRKPGILATIFYILEKHNLDVISAHVSSDLIRTFYMIHAHASGASEELVQVEDVFKLAAGEMNLWILSCQ